MNAWYDAGMENDRFYRGTEVTMRIIRKYVRAVAERFQPEKIILFGSHAYGTPHQDSDVDLLVIMSARNELDQSHRIHWTLLPPFALDIIVRTPKNLAWRLKEGDWFLREVIEKGKVLYEAADKGVGRKGRTRPYRRARKQSKQSTSA
jgi:uncharacterized protein